MLYDHQWHRRRARSRRSGRRGAIGLILLAGLCGLAVERAIPRRPLVPAPATAGIRFGLCHGGGGWNCVVDGDTFRLGGSRIRLADIDAPETHPPRCADEAARGARATLRLQQLLNAGSVTLAGVDRDEDRYGRKLRVVMRGGRSLGAALVAEGLARPWTGRRAPWCA